MTTPYVAWKDSYSVGHPELDAQHQTMFRLLNELHEALETGETQRPCEQLLDDACRYAEFHFGREEALMALGGFPNLPDHRAAHRAYVQRVQEIRQAAAGAPDDQFYELFAFLRGWWLEHITRLDAEYAPALRSVR
jgi:hemerythrin